MVFFTKSCAFGGQLIRIPHPTRLAERWRMVTLGTNYGFQMLKFAFAHFLNQFYFSTVDFECITFNDLRLYFCA